MKRAIAIILETILFLFVFFIGWFLAGDSLCAHA